MRTAVFTALVLSLGLLASEARVPKKKCSPPPEYPHTSLAAKYTGVQRFSSGEKVYYNCAEDFNPTKGLRVVQCVDGKWSKLTLKCEKKSCGNAGDLPNGQFQYEGNSFVGEKVYAVCNEGYTLKGLSYMICKKSGWTGEFPSCEVSAKVEVEVEATCSSPAVANSVSSAGHVSVHLEGDNVTFTCSPGFRLDGAQQIACGPGGQWRPQPPQCLPSPEQTPPTRKPTGGCGVPMTTSSSKAILADQYITRTSFASGDKVHYVCEIGYVQAGGSRYRKCNEGKWTPLRLRCERKTCGSAGEIIHGQFTYTGVEFGDTATAECDEGYQLVGRATRNCMVAGWDGRVPACEPAECEEPPEVTNAEMIGHQEPPYTYGNVVQYWCRVGTLHGPKEIWCTEDGTWSSSPPECKEITCPSPVVPNGIWAGGQREFYPFRHTITIQCNPGHMMSGSKMITCGHDGRWSPELPRCLPTSRRNYR